MRTPLSLRVVLGLLSLPLLGCSTGEGDESRQSFGLSDDEIGSFSTEDSETANDEAQGTETSAGTEDTAGTGDSEAGSTDSDESGSTESGNREEGSTETAGTEGSGSSEEGSTGMEGTGESGMEESTEGGESGGVPPFVAECDDDPANPIILTVLGGATARYPTIVAAIASASGGSTIEICPGTYAEDIEVTLEITLRGAGPDLTIIDNGGLYFDLGNGEALVENIAFTHSNAKVPGGWNIASSGAISVDDTYGEQETLTVRNCEFYDNDATYGAAMHVDGSNNGGKNPHIYIEDCLFENNLATGEGGAIASYGRVHISDSIFLDNEAPTGGALALSYGCVVQSDCDITDTIIQRNHASGTSQYQGGGGLFLDDCGGGCLSRLTVTGADLGFGAQEENTDHRGLPQDVFVNDGASPWASYGWYHNGVSFACADGSCAMP